MQKVCVLKKSYGEKIFSSCLTKYTVNSEPDDACHDKGGYDLEDDDNFIYKIGFL